MHMHTTDICLCNLPLIFRWILDTKKRFGILTQTTILCYAILYCCAQENVPCGSPLLGNYSATDTEAFGALQCKHDILQKAVAEKVTRVACTYTYEWMGVFLPT